jgi:hypothetical protein
VGDLLPDCDVFAHFWDSETRGTNFANREGAASTASDWHDTKLSNPEKNVEFFRAWTPRTIMIEEYDLQPSKKLWGGRRWDPVAQKYQVSMWRSVYEAIWDYDGRRRIEDIFWLGDSYLMDQVSTYCAAHANTITNIDDPQLPDYEDWQWHSFNWITKNLGYNINALSNNMMRIYTEQDIVDNVDPMNPGWGRAPLYGAYNDKNIEKIRRW